MQQLVLIKFQVLISRTLRVIPKVLVVALKFLVKHKYYYYLKVSFILIIMTISFYFVTLKYNMSGKALNELPSAQNDNLDDKELLPRDL